MNSDLTEFYKLYLREGTLPWAIFRFRIFLNYLSQKELCPVAYGNWAPSEQQRNLA